MRGVSSNMTKKPSEVITSLPAHSIFACITKQISRFLSSCAHAWPLVSRKFSQCGCCHTVTKTIQIIKGTVEARVHRVREQKGGRSHSSRQDATTECGLLVQYHERNIAIWCHMYCQQAARRSNASLCRCSAGDQRAEDQGPRYIPIYSSTYLHTHIHIVGIQGLDERREEKDQQQQSCTCILLCLAVPGSACTTQNYLGTYGDW